MGTSVYGSNGNSLPSPPPEFMQELRVNTSMYDAQQGATSGAQIDVNTTTGTNNWHGQVYGTFANNALNAVAVLLQPAVPTCFAGRWRFPGSMANPWLHRWTAGATAGGPIIKNKLFFFVAYQHRYDSRPGNRHFAVDGAFGLTDDRSAAGLAARRCSLERWHRATAAQSTRSRWP